MFFCFLFFFSKIELIRLKKECLKIIPYFAFAPCSKGMNPILPIPYFAYTPCPYNFKGNLQMADELNWSCSMSPNY